MNGARMRESFTRLVAERPAVKKRVVIGVVGASLAVALLSGCGTSNPTTTTTTVAVSSTTSTSTSTTVPSAAAVAKRVAASLVMVQARQSDSTSAGGQTVWSTGVGVVYSDDGLILTRGSLVVDDNGKPRSPIKVRLPDKEFVAATLVGEDKTADVALLRIKKNGLLPIGLASGDAVVGQWVALVSNIGSTLASLPASVVGTNESISTSSGLKGLIAVKPSKSLQQGQQVCQAFDAQGNLIGLVVAVTRGSQQEGGPTFDSLLVVPAGKVAAAAAKLAGS